ncbi:hypothetical protein RZE82_07760 [Mollicutes bacterium LVI A0039]|nr:hypothetical protein RZE82_07760 [Mollicutes bacterium LVI A0039]
MREDTVLKVGDIIDLNDTTNVYMPTETKQQMRKYKKTREYVEQMYL